MSTKSSRTRSRRSRRSAAPDWFAPPRLRGYIWDPCDAYDARDREQLLSIRLETNRTCNLRCRYCNLDRNAPGDVPYDALIDVVRQARDLGARSIVVGGSGEPTLHPRFLDLIAFIRQQGLIPVVFSNLLAVTPDLAAFLYEHDVSVMGKLDSLRPEVQDYLAGARGAAVRIHAGLDALLDAGYAGRPDQQDLRLGLAFVSCRINIDELETLWLFCRTRGIFPHIEILSSGHAHRHLPQAHLSTREILQSKLRLLEIDRRDFGYDWLPYTPIAAGTCLQHLAGLYVTAAGDVRPCAHTRLDDHPALRDGDGLYPYNVRRLSLKDIYHSDLFEYLRHIDLHLEGHCGDCENHDRCIGCRGFAYTVGVARGLTPRQALRSQCLLCLKQPLAVRDAGTPCPSKAPAPSLASPHRPDNSAPPAAATSA